MYLKYIELINKKIPIELDTHSLSDKIGFPTTNIYNKEMYLNTYFHVLTETEVDNNKVFFTEKILKPILGLQPFLVLSSKKYLFYLKKLGFKTFDSIWNEEYDLVDDSIDRFNLVFDTINEICNWSIEECEKKYKSVLDICIYNRNHLYSIQNGSQFKEIFKKIENEW